MRKEIDGQINMFDYLESIKGKDKSPIAGAWVETHGKRILFDDIEVGKYYIADYSTASNNWFKIVFVKKKTEDSIMYVDDPKGIKGEWGWGKSYSALTRKDDVNSDPNTQAGEGASMGWWYLIDEEIVYPVVIKGICDDAYCPKCDISINEIFWMDCERCPYCGCRISWEPWHRANDKDNEETFGKDWREKFGKKRTNRGRDKQIDNG